MSIGVYLDITNTKIFNLNFIITHGHPDPCDKNSYIIYLTGCNHQNYKLILSTRNFYKEFKTYNEYINTLGYEVQNVITNIVKTNDTLKFYFLSTKDDNIRTKCSYIEDTAKKIIEYVSLENRNNTYLVTAHYKISCRIFGYTDVIKAIGIFLFFEKFIGKSDEELMEAFRKLP